MARRKRASQEDVDSDHKSIQAMADRMGLKDEDRAKYVHSHMTKLGHRPKTSYVPSDDDEDSKDSGNEDPFFN